MKTSLKRAMRAHLDAQRLSPDRLDALLELTQTQSPQTQSPQGVPTPAVRSQRRRALGVGVSALAASITLGVFGLTWQAHGLPDRVARDVAENHLNLKPADIKSSNLNEVSAFLTQLDFKLVQSKRLFGDDWVLTGARYCQILGTTAAQLHLVYRGSGGVGQARESSVETLYQVKHSSGWFSVLPKVEENEPPIEIMLAGLRVLVWLEKGVLFAMTTPRDV